MSRPLVVAAHGTASLEGQAAVRECAARAMAVLGMAGPPVVGYVDVCGPTLEEVLGDVEDPVVVPYFLASGYHVKHDVPSATEQSPGALVTPALGVEPEVLDAVTDRVRESLGADGPDDAAPAVEAVLLLGAGSSVDSARAEVADVAAQVAGRFGAASGTAFLSGPGPRPADELARLRAQGHTRIAVAAHLLSPGFFLDRAHQVAVEAGAQPTAPLGTHPLLGALVARRYGEALA